MISEAVKDGRVTPAKKQEVIDLAHEIGIKGITSYLSMLPKLVSGKTVDVKEQAPSNVSSVSTLSRADKAVLHPKKGFKDPITGRAWTEEEFMAAKKSVEAKKAARLGISEDDE